MDEIEIVAYRAEWPAMFDSEAKRLRALLPAHMMLGVHHIGSTAVPGLAAKPVIDMMLLTPNLAEARRRLVETLEAAGYAFWADNPAPDRLFFVKGLPPSAPHRTHHLHIVADPKLLDRHLAFRHRLQGDPVALADYAALKHRLAARYADNREAYTSAKADWIANTLSEKTG